jgi:phospholipid/cholesterol/gamma-HCH transport system substrate-binding protein
VAGLEVHAPVRTNGIKIGTVIAIHLADKPSGPARKIEILLQIEKRYQGEILSDSSASLTTLGLLGSRYVNIDRGVRGNPISPGGEIPSAPTTTFDLRNFTESLAKIVGCADQRKQDRESKPQSH